MNKRIVVISDTHCGHYVGLTPPGWQRAAGALAASTLPIRVEAWKWYAQRMKAIQPVHACFANGDLVDGRGERSGSTELLTVDPADQVNIAVRCLQETRARHYVITYGTPYHTGTSSDVENAVASQVNAEIAGHVWPEVNGLVFDLKHKVGGSSVPHGRHTPVARDRLWNMIWASRDEQPNARVLIRSHVHSFSFTGDGYWLGMTTPPLQAAATKYGARQCSGTVDFGFVVFDVSSSGEFTWHAELVSLRGTKASRIKV